MSTTEIKEHEENDGTQAADASECPPEYNLYISKDRVSILLDCPDPHEETDDLINQIITDFKRLEIPEYPDSEILRKILETSCHPGENLVGHVIMMGQPVSPSINGRLEWTRDFFAGGWEIDEDTGAIDFWAKCESRSVNNGELLVCLYHPIDGTAGLNVFGNEIPVTKPSKVKLRSGKNVSITEHDDRLCFTATTDGRIRFADGVVAVDDVYNIKGNVSLETGNIIHAGAVMIQGDVTAGATLEVEGDIIVKGMLEPCHIKCGGSLTVAGGIVGDENYSIVVDDDLVARYISEACIEVGGNILVGNEVSHSRISCLGKMKVTKGRIAGGVTIALKGIRVAEAGASGAVDTLLVAGIDYTLKDKLLWHNKKIIKLEEAQEKIEGALFKGQQKKGTSEKEQETIRFFKQKLGSISQAIADEHMLMQKLKVDALNAAVEEVLIMKELWSGTTIQLGKEKLTVRSSVLKPRIAQKKKRKVMINPLGEGNMPED